MDSKDIKELSPEEMSQVIGGGSDLKNYYTYLQQKYGNLSKDVMKLKVTSAEYAY